MFHFMWREIIIALVCIEGFANAVAQFNAGGAGGSVVLGTITGNTAYVGSSTASTNGKKIFINGTTVGHQ